MFEPLSIYRGKEFAPFTRQDQPQHIVQLLSPKKKAEETSRLSKYLPTHKSLTPLLALLLSHLLPVFSTQSDGRQVD